MAYKAADSLMLSLTIGGKTIFIGGEDTPYQLLSSGFSGGEGAEAVLSLLEHAQLDGSAVVSRRVAGRALTLLFEIADYANRETYRTALLSFFRPGADGILTVKRTCGGSTAERSIGCTLSGCVTMTQETLSSYIRVRVPLYCADPYFSSETDVLSLKKTSEPLLTFPLTVTEDSGATAGMVSVGDTILLDNDGDVPAGFHLQLTASDRDSENACVIINPTLTRAEDGAFIRILTTLNHGDTLTVSTFPGAKYVLKNGGTCLLFDRESTFFPLLCGRNTLCLSADASNGNLEAELSYRMRWFGV
ncbi:MAG: phage tail family protein [Clostridia bacterium]|nr:phage tail family protein [Clostridia bacterium]